MGGLFQGGPPNFKDPASAATGRLATILSDGDAAAPPADHEAPDVIAMPGDQLAQAFPRPNEAENRPPVTGPLVSITSQDKDAASMPPQTLPARGAPIAVAPGDLLTQAFPSEATEAGEEKLSLSAPAPQPKLVRLKNVPITPGADLIPYVHPTMVDKVIGFIGELRQNGIPAALNSAFRTTARQAKYYGNKNGGAAPGRSLHEAGYAIDINIDLNKLAASQRSLALQIADRYGLRWGGLFSTTDPGHFFIDPFPGSMSDREAAIRATQQEYQEMLQSNSGR
jgi:hypothetical protein